MGETYDLVVIGGNAGGLSAAAYGSQAGMGSVRVIEAGSEVAFPQVLGQNSLEVSYGETVSGIDVEGDHLEVTTDKRSYATRAVLIATRHPDHSWEPSVPVVAGERVLIDRIPDDAKDADILVVGHTDHSIELTAALADAGSGVVLAAGGLDPSKLSPVAASLLGQLERDRRVTVLYRSLPSQIGEADGYPMAFFDDRRTPDLQFDYVVFASGRKPAQPSDVGLSDDGAASGRVWFLGEPDETPDHLATAPGWRVGEEIVSAAFADVDSVAVLPPPTRARDFAGAADELRAEHYNATITHFEPTHSDLWVLRVKPDHGSVSHLPGQYASLGLGYWEDRIDDATDPDLDARWDKLIRRSYSISNRIFDEHGYLASDAGADELEFYIVLVPPTPDNIPGLTPRLALKRPGDRVYLGPKVAGRYTLAAVTDPASTVLLLSTGTGEAPHNAMVTELLRKGHHGPIVSAVSVRQWADLGYIEQHRELERRYPNYHYVPMPTREPDVEKRYIQDLISSGDLAKEVGGALEPERTHVFLCGNPSMIGLPDDDGKFPEVTGVVELLSDQGFTLDHRKQRGNIHFEEYW